MTSSHAPQYLVVFFLTLSVPVILRVLLRFYSRGVCGIISRLLVLFDLASPLQLLLLLEFVFAHLTAGARVESFTPDHCVDQSTLGNVLPVVDAVVDLHGISDGLRFLRQVKAQIRITLDETDYALIPLIKALKRLLVDIRGRGLDGFL